MSSNQTFEQSFDLPSAQQFTNSAAELCEQYFGAKGLYPCAEVLSERNQMYKPEHTNAYFDISLFPYRADGSFDPPIPTLNDIIMAQPTDAVIERVWQVGKYIVKLGCSAAIYMEAENLLYLERHTNVRAPKLYAAFTSDDEDPLQYNVPGEPRTIYYYLIMELIRGEIIDDIDVKELKPYIKEKIWALLGEQFRQLRSVKPENPKHFGRIQGRAYGQMPPLYYAPAPDFANYGPFTYEQLVQRLIRAAKIGSALATYPRGDYTTVQRLAYNHAESVMLKGAGPSDRLPVLSHLDPQTHNIIVNLKRDQNGEPYDVEEVALVDWFSLCWMPAWYEAGDMCRLTFCLDPTLQSMGMNVLETMGKVNLEIAAFFGACVRYHAFHLYH
ncbi:hypothetical protein P154DRAFT_570761 [Amniculicola lignicola CBS 123094]|uniref:Aminoglycoside phosphotransferase domain-containing protein n=1 Tax=Amniculicola lignicola CBS 123094 TaxID=1392246 RepID=A0A6A5WZ28_9PLEO|nr:hypothetical protein P154DRAFT_570761 [Amniculicola lignicola CBS 123094]